MRILKLSVLLIFIAITRPCSGTIIAYTFQGTVSSSLGNPYGLSIPGATSVSGQFAYDPTSTGTFVSANATKYLQHQTNGFIAHFGSNEIRGSDYLVTVSNGLTSPNRDQFDISFRNDPLLTGKSLYVNNDAKTPATALLVVSLRFPNTEINSTLIPTSLDPSHLTVAASSSLLGDSASPKIFFTIQSIAQLQLPDAVPEPSAMALSLVAMAGAISLLRMYRGRLKE
ncbi:MAG: hypothetical protein K8T91_13305 [Planctomycetes bacterium]|nr:hypothetical protein [Planctomycetota bacterium]